MNIYNMDTQKNKNVENVKTAIFGGGCFWCTESVFKMLKGVESVLPGYAGGSTWKEKNANGAENAGLRAGKVCAPTYSAVSSGTTGHAEVIKIEYDPTLVTFENLLTVFFASHDPTTLNRQGADVGTQYRSIILYTEPEQKVAAEKFIAELNASSAEGQPIVTEIEPLDEFFPAENYHVDYYAQNKDQPYCQVIINPKLQKVQEKFADLIK